MKKSNYFGPMFLVAVSLQIMMSASAKADEDLIAKLDLDLDGQITIKEAVADPAVLASFGRIDRNGDGKISREELAKVELIAHAKPSKR